MDFIASLDSQSSVPLHRQLYEEIRRAILSGRLPAGQRVPSTRALSESLGISRATVTMAFDYLLSEGYLQSYKGSGTFVCRQLPEELLRPSKVVKKTTETLPKKLSGKRLSKYGINLRDQSWLNYGDKEPEIQFSFGRPDITEFPIRIWQQLMNEHCKNMDIGELDCPSKVKGNIALRQEIQKYLSRARAVNCDIEQIIIVNGSQQALDLVTRVMIDRGDAVGIEEPCYIGAKKAFEAQGAELVPIPVDESGIVVDSLKSLAGKSSPTSLPSLTNKSLKLVYVTPSHQFPTGVVLSLPRRLELLSWAERTQTYIVEDDYDSEYRYSGRPIPALAGFNDNESVIYIGTFSKVLFPSLRIGYLVVPKPLQEVFARAKWLADRHTPLLEQQVLADFIRQGHMERHVRRMRTIYEHKRKTIIAALQKHFGKSVSILGDNAGINVLVRFENVENNDHIVQEALDLGVGIVRTKQFYLTIAPDGEFLINYGGLSEEQIEEGVKRLATAIKKDTGVRSI